MGEALQINKKGAKALEDNKIVELFLSRDESAIEHSRIKYGTRLRLMSQGIVQDSQTAEECENDTYLRAWQSIPPNEPYGYLYAFLARIIRNLSLNCCRNRDRLKRSAHICELSAEMEQCIPSSDDVECRIDDIQFTQAINGFLATLSDNKRNIFVRRYWYLDSVEDIAIRFGISKSKATSILFRCRNKLREYLIKEGYTL